jgi:hypothetical protein
MTFEIVKSFIFVPPIVVEFGFDTVIASYSYSFGPSNLKTIKLIIGDKFKTKCILLMMHLISGPVRSS